MLRYGRYIRTASGSDEKISEFDFLLLMDVGGRGTDGEGVGAWVGAPGFGGFVIESELSGWLKLEGDDCFLTALEMNLAECFQFLDRTND